MAVLVNQDVGLETANVSVGSKRGWGLNTYPLEVPMDYPLAMYIGESPSDVSKLQRSCNLQSEAVTRSSNGMHTSFNRSAVTSTFTNSVMLPFVIQSDIITNRFSDIVTPNSGNTFGWRRAFHITTSLQNLCAGHDRFVDTGDKLRVTHFSDPLKVIS